METPLTDPEKGPQRVNRASEFHESSELEMVIDGQKQGAPMPYALFFDEEGRALHAGNVRQPFASHGCVRLPTKAAHALFHGFDHRQIQVIVTHNRALFELVWERGYFADRVLAARKAPRQANTWRWGENEIDPDMLWHEEDE